MLARGIDARDSFGTGKGLTLARIKKQAVVAEAATIAENAEKLRDIVCCQQAAGKRVVMANGKFDLLHVGHTRLLKDAKSRGDYLVVAVNSDESVQNYTQNTDLPIQCEGERMEVVAAIRWVDYVVKFDEATADEVIRAIQPDIVAKGTDYTEETVPERETIAEYGGAIAICGDEKDHASSQIISRINDLKS